MFDALVHKNLAEAKLMCFVLTGLPQNISNQPSFDCVMLLLATRLIQSYTDLQ